MLAFCFDRVWKLFGSHNSSIIAPRWVCGCLWCFMVSGTTLKPGVVRLSPFWSASLGDKCRAIHQRRWETSRKWNSCSYICLESEVGSHRYYVWMKNRQGGSSKVYSFCIAKGECVKYPASPNRRSLPPCPVSIRTFLLWLLFQGLSYLLAKLRQAWIGRSASTRLILISSAGCVAFNFFTWPLPLAWQPSTMGMLCSGKVLREEGKDCHSPRMWMRRSFPRAVPS